MTNKKEHFDRHPGKTLRIKLSSNSGADQSACLLLAEFPNIDAEQAIKQLDLEISDYIEFLKRFSVNNRDDSSTLSKLIDSEDWEDALRLTHTSKGLCRTIGATKLSQGWLALEKELRKAEKMLGSGELQVTEEDKVARRDELNMLLKGTEIELKEVTSFIDRLPVKRKSPSQRKTGSEGDPVQELKELWELTEEYDVSSIGKIESMLQSVAYDQLVDELNGVRKYLVEFDFVAASNKLKKLLTSIEQST